MRFFGLILLLALASGAGATFLCVSVRAEGPHPMTLEASYEAAKKRSETVAIQGALVTQIEERYRQALGSVFPTISAVGSYFTQDPNAVVFAGQPTQTVLRVTATQPLFRGFREFAAVRGSEDLLLAQIETRRQAEQQLYLDVAQNFFTIRALEKDLSLVRNELNQYDRRIAELRQRMRIGRSRLYEALSTESARSALVAQSHQIEGQIASAREAYWFLTGKDARTPLFADELNRPKPALGALLESLELRPEIRAEKARVSAAEENVNIANGADWPSLDLNGNWYPYKNGLSNTSLWDIQVQASLPLYAGGTYNSKKREMRAALSGEDLALVRARRVAQEEIRQVYDILSADYLQVEELEHSWSLSERTRTEEMKEYRLGLVTNLDVLQAITGALESHRALERARYTLLLDRERLEVAAALKPAPFAKY